MLRNKAKKRTLMKDRNENGKVKISKMSKQIKVDNTFLPEENSSMIENNSSVKEKNSFENEEIPSLLEENNQNIEKNNSMIEENTGKFFSEALILESVNPQYDERLFIEFPQKYKFATCCVQILI